MFCQTLLYRKERSVCQCITYLFVTGFLERELKKDSIPMTDNGENPLAPLPREMIDLEVLYLCCFSTMYIY